MKKDDLENYTKAELKDMFVDLINEMEKEGYRYINEWKKDNDKLEMYTYGGALLTRVNRIKAIVSMKNSNTSKKSTGQILYYRFGLGIKKYGYDSKFRKEYESITAQLRHHELNEFFDKWDVPKN